VYALASLDKNEVSRNGVFLTSAEMEGNVVYTDALAADPKTTAAKVPVMDTKSRTQMKRSMISIVAQTLRYSILSSRHSLCKLVAIKHSVCISSVC
jgi:hypothetical protein